MNNQRLDLSVLPDGFLVERLENGRAITRYRLERMSNDRRTEGDFRPALNHWYFNDGSVVLPDGLVVDLFYKCEFTQEDVLGLRAFTETVFDSDERVFIQKMPCEYEKPTILTEYEEIVAVRILGVTPEYAEHGAELGMEVVEV